MDAVEFLKAKKRMHDTYTNRCSECPVGSTMNGKNEFCHTFEHNYPQECIEIMEKWWSENKPLTNAEWVAEKLREIGYNVDMVALKNKCPVPFSGCYTLEEINCKERPCIKCKKWWDEEHKEVEECLK